MTRNWPSGENFAHSTWLLRIEKFGQKFYSFSPKIEVFGQKVFFSQKWNFGQKILVDQKFCFLTNGLIFNQNFIFGKKMLFDQKLLFLPKRLNFDKNFNFWSKFQFLTKYFYQNLRQKIFRRISFFQFSLKIFPTRPFGSEFYCLRHGRRVFFLLFDLGRRFSAEKVNLRTGR